jgi:multidrug efflux pump subunit AcrA (membrane-fusion protein)
VSEQTINRESSAAVPGQAARNGPPSLSERVQSLRLPDRKSAPASWRTFVPWVLCAVLAACTAYLTLRDDLPAGEARNPGEPVAGSKGAADNLLPGAAAPLAAPGEVVLQLKGNITPIRQIQVSPKVAGTVEKLRFKEGDVVKKGDVLAVLETVEYDSDYKRCVATKAAAAGRWAELEKYRGQEIAQAKADLDETDYQREQLYLDWKRSIGLRGQALSAREYEQAEGAFRSMDRRSERLRLALALMKKGPRDERIATAKAEYEQAEADLVKAKWRLDNCVVLAPISGIILTKKAEEGNLVNPSAFTIAASLCDMADLAELEVDLRVPERDIARVFREQRDEAKKCWRRQKCQVIPEGYPDRSYEGFVSRIMPQADRGNAAVQVRIKIRIPREEAGQYLRPDMGALVRCLNDWVETEE